MNLLKKKNIIFFVFSIFLLISFMSCSSTQKYPAEATIDGSVTIKPKKFDSPDNTGLAFGFITGGKSLMGSDKYPGGLFFLQINPKMEAKSMVMAFEDMVFYTSSQPVGMHFHLVSRVTTSGNVTYYQYPGIQDAPGAIDVIIKKPGLNYFGSYTVDKSNNFVTDDTKTELDALKILKKKLAKTSWENTIDSRIKELEK